MREVISKAISSSLHDKKFVETHFEKKNVVLVASELLVHFKLFPHYFKAAQSSN